MTLTKFGLPDWRPGMDPVMHQVSSSVLLFAPQMLLLTSSGPGHAPGVAGAAPLPCVVDG